MGELAFARNEQMTEGLTESKNKNPSVDLFGRHLPYEGRLGWRTDGRHYQKIVCLIEKDGKNFLRITQNYDKKFVLYDEKIVDKRGRVC